MPETPDGGEPGVSGAPDLAGLASSLLGRGDDKGAIARWGQRLAAAHLAYMTGRQVQQQWRNWRNQQRYSVALYDGDVLYAPVQGWILARMPPQAQRAVLVRSERAGHDEMMSPERDRHAPVPALQVHFDGDRAQRVTIDGHPVVVGVERKQFGDAGSDSRSYRPAKITFGCRTLAARDAVLDWLRQLRAELATEGRTARLYTATRWGDWHSARSLPPRPADSVVLPHGLLDDLVEDLHRFFALRDRYRQLGQPWHRGFLLHGPPGTGKTSTAQALASACDLDVYYMPLSDLQQDTDLGRLLGAIGPRSMLLLEDVDVSHAATTRDDTAQGLSTSGLLNALDGIVTPEGLVTVMTTNHRDVLDAALIRPGRADREIELGYLTDDHFNRLATHLVGGRWDCAGIAELAITPADVVEVIKRHLDDDQQAAKELAAWLTDRRS